jgi:hypothetical protein
MNFFQMQLIDIFIPALFKILIWRQLYGYMLLNIPARSIYFEVRGAFRTPIIGAENNGMA